MAILELMTTFSKRFLGILWKEAFCFRTKLLETPKRFFLLYFDRNFCINYVWIFVPIELTLLIVSKKKLFWLSWTAVFLIKHDDSLQKVRCFIYLFYMKYSWQLKAFCILRGNKIIKCEGTCCFKFCQLLAIHTSFHHTEREGGLK